MLTWLRLSSMVLGLVVFAGVFSVCCDADTLACCDKSHIEETQRDHRPDESYRVVKPIGGSLSPSSPIEYATCMQALTRSNGRAAPIPLAWKVARLRI